MSAHPKNDHSKVLDRVGRYRRRLFKFQNRNQTLERKSHKLTSIISTYSLSVCHIFSFARHPSGVPGERSKIIVRLTAMDTFPKRTYEHQLLVNISVHFQRIYMFLGIFWNLTAERRIESTE